MPALQLRRRLKNALESRGYEIRRQPRDLEPEFLALFEQVRPYTGVSIHRCYELFQAIGHVVRHRIPGAFVECGVQLGGSSMLAALALRHFGADRDMYLYDTFAGMPEPTEDDVAVNGQPASVTWRKNRRETHNEWAYGSLETVRANMDRTGYDSARLHYVQGMVEDTIPGTVPEKIAVLRLDTDWYESTMHELVHLYPRLSIGGVLYIDDFGVWLGARKAVTEYFETQATRPMLTRLDGGSRIAIRLAEPEPGPAEAEVPLERSLPR